MNLDFSAEDLAFRDEVRAFIAENYPASLRGKQDEGDELAKADFLSWHKVLAKKGWVAPAWPAEYGGTGWTSTQRYIWSEETARADCIRLMPFGLAMVGPVIYTFGTPEQKAKFLPRILSGEDWWCQGYSEPGAGSDLASLACKAVKDGEEWLVNGQKVWNTMAHLADKGMLVTRTDPEQVKHRGMTYFAVDMHAPGVEVRPLRQITGEAEFNEVYLTDVRIPDGDRIGDVGQGWAVSMTTLMNERTTIGGGGSGQVRPAGSGPIAEAVRLYKAKVERTGHVDVVQKDALMHLWIKAEVLRLTNIRAGQNRRVGNPGPEGSIAKVAHAEVNQQIYAMCVDILGMDGQVGFDYDMKRSDAIGLEGPPGSSRKMFLRARANSIEGGTSQIQRNILGERVLGLPGDVRVDKALPWSQVPR